MLKRAFGIVLVLASVHAQAEMRSSGAVSTELKDQTLRATLKEGFHFNEKAPNSVVIDGQTMKPTKLEPREGVFTNLPPSFSKGHASLYVCDDAQTFCEPHRIDLKGGAPAVASSESAKAASASRGQVNLHGFIEDDFNKALDLAKKQKRLVLMDFSARWCPGCVRLETEVFDTAAFKSLTKNFVKLKIDVDRFENGFLSEKFKINGIPTLLVVDANQNEIDRVYDYQPIATLDAFFTSVRKDPTSIDDLKAKSRSGDSRTLLRLGKRLLASGREAESFEVLSQVKPTPPELLTAKVKAAAFAFKNDPATKSKYVQALKEAIGAEPGSSRSLDWRTQLIEQTDDADQRKQIAQEGVKIADGLLGDRKKLKVAVENDLVGEFTGYEPLLAATYRASLIEASTKSDPAITREAWQKAAEVGRGLKITPRTAGPAMRYLLTLIQAKEFEGADTFAAAMLKRDPGNPEPQRRRLRVLVELKRYVDAIKLGEESLKNSYGRNEFWVAESLAKAYIGARRESDAKALLDRYLSRTDVEWSNIQSSRKSMEELRKSVASAQ